MLLETRLNQIISIVEQQKSVTVQELTKQLGISESTVRRDLTLLGEKGKLIKVHGGAVAAENIYLTKDKDIPSREELNKEEKIIIAKYAASLIKSDDFIYLDAGTTTELLIDYIAEKNAIFVTNAIRHAKKLSNKGFQTYVLGGEFKPVTEAVIGDQAIENLSKYNFTIGFFGTNGVNKEIGFTTPDMSEAMIKKNSMKHCRERYVLCDSSKFELISPVTFADFDYAKIITTKVKQNKYINCKNILEVKEV